MTLDERHDKSVTNCIDAKAALLGSFVVVSVKRHCSYPPTPGPQQKIQFEAFYIRLVELHNRGLSGGTYFGNIQMREILCKTICTASLV